MKKNDQKYFRLIHSLIYYTIFFILMLLLFLSNLRPESEFPWGFIKFHLILASFVCAGREVHEQEGYLGASRWRSAARCPCPAASSGTRWWACWPRGGRAAEEPGDTRTDAHTLHFNRASTHSLGLGSILDVMWSLSFRLTLTVHWGHLADRDTAIYIAEVHKDRERAESRRRPVGQHQCLDSKASDYREPAPVSRL